ncbi:hypothetical protein HDV06_004646 [Boothiomyces sp. JEL0866]|nr:hypothetical protein HDV06_004646 [Boothiomyces sp. JEL0866]
MNSIISTLKSGAQEDKFEAIKNSIHYTDSPDRFAKELLPLILSQIQDTNTSDKIKISILETLPHVADCALNCSAEYQFPVLASCIEAVVALFEQPQCIKHAIVAYANMYSLALTILARQPGQPAYWGIMGKLNITIDSLFQAPNMGLKASAASSSVFICVVLNHIHGIIKECHTFSNPLIDLVLKFNPSLTLGSDAQKRDVRRTFKIVLLSCLDIPQIESSHAEIARILGEMGYSRDVMIKQSREKRLLDKEELEYEFKKTKVDPEPQQKVVTPKEIIPLIPTIPLDFMIPLIIQTIAEADEIEAENDTKEDAIEIDVDQILSQTNELTSEDRQEIVQDCLSRILQMDSYFQKVDKAVVVNNDTKIAGRFGWLLVSARLMTRSNSNEKLKEHVLGFIGGNLSARIELGLYWLFEEYINGSEYNLWLKRFLSILENENQEERLFTKFLVEVPEMTEFAISKGLTTLRDLIQNRPSCRNTCLEHLLSFSTDSDDDTRMIAVDSLKTFIPSNETVTVKIVDFAQENLKKLNEMTVNVHSHLDLYLGCCSAKPLLLKGLFENYPLFHSDVAPQVLASSAKLFDSLHGEPEPLFELLESYPNGSESLLLALIKSLMNNETLKDKTIEIVKKVYLKKDLDVQFLLLIINHYDKATVLNQLDKLVESLDESDEQKITIKDVFVSLVEIKEEQQLLTPNELLIKLHLLENVTVKKQCKAIDICFIQTSVFTQEVVAIVLAHLVDQVKLSPLLMRTIILALKTYPDLSSFIVQQQTKLINKKIWLIKPLWEGFAKCCVALEVFDMEGDLRTLVAEYIDKLSEQQQKKREIVTLKALIK